MSRTYLLLLLCVGCSLWERDNPNYCPGNPGNNCQNMWDASADPRCSGDQECAAPTPACDTTAMACVQCTATNASACSGSTPVCGNNNTCRACVAHSECASNVCRPDGTCSNGTDVAYVDPAGTDNASCTMAMPCTKLSKALETNRPYVKLHGTTDEGVTIMGGRKVTFLADPGAVLTRSSGAAPIISVQDDGTELSIFDLAISNAPNNTSGRGIAMQAIGSPSVALTRARVSNNPAGGIAAFAGTLTVKQSTIADNAGAGIVASGGTLTVSQSMISSNTGGGISMVGAGVQFTITNNLVYRNGNTTTTSVGGIAAVPSGTSKMQFNTIVDNLANAGVASAGGVFCDQTGFVAANNIIFRNSGGTAGNVQTLGNCTYGNSFVAPGTGSVDNTPGFNQPNTPPFNYHLTAATPATIRDAAGACSDIDLDGDTRPSGSACDLGADEYVP